LVEQWFPQKLQMIVVLNADYQGWPLEADMPDFDDALHK
jgi:hypothetical protein